LERGTEVTKNVIFAISLRIIIILTVIPFYPKEFFAPFLMDLEFNKDIWSSWISSGGDSRAFPYGLAMLFVYLPSLLFSQLLQMFSIEATRALEISIGLQILAIEGLLWRLIRKNKRMAANLNAFLFSPLLIWVNYFLGLNDLFPSALLFLASLLLLSHRYKLAGVLIGMAIGMKFSLALVLPFLFIFALDNPRYMRRIWTTFFVSLLTGLLLYTPGVFSEGFREMVFSNKESKKAFEYAFTFENSNLLILPLIYILLLYWIWKAGRISVDVLIAFFGIALFLISAFSPASIGWMIWGFPLIIMNLVDQKQKMQIFFIQALFLLPSISDGTEIESVFGSVQPLVLRETIQDLLFTAGVSLVAIYCYSSLKRAIVHGDLYRISRAPLMVSIAGDSGTGKDTLSQALVNMFTPNTATILCGDDYHKFERGDISWENTTHLNPAANHLDIWERDYKLAHQRKYFEQREYDHVSGKFSKFKPRLRRDLIISQGLHGLYSRVSMKSDISIFLSMEDQLRVRLKLERDATQRNHTHSSVIDVIRKREIDYQNYVAPQIDKSDIHYYLFEIDGEIHLRISSTNSYLEEHLIPALREHIEITKISDVALNSFIYELNPSGVSQIALRSLMKMHIPDHDQLFLEEPTISKGAIGIMSTISIILMAEKRRESFA
jgi:uridine kinase